jgi:type IV pilus assembly protein PilW
MSKLKKSILVNSSGFTLIELLVAMAVASIVMAAIGSAYWIQMQTSREQQMVVGMQQSMRAAMYLLERDIKMAGYDDDHNTAPTATITTADSTNFTFEFVDDTDTQVTVAYSLYDALGDGDNDIGRSVDSAPRAAIAENIEELEFFYTLADGTQTLAPTTQNDRDDIQVVGVSIVARTSAQTRTGDSRSITLLSGTVFNPPDDGFKRQRVTAMIRCRNMIIN